MQLDLTANQLTLQLEWYEQLCAFTLHNPMVIPLGHLVRATTEEPPSRWTDIRSPGTSVPGLIRAGTYHTRQGREFWYATKDQKFLVLELRDESYQKIVLTLDDHQVWADRINQAISNATGEMP